MEYFLSRCKKKHLRHKIHSPTKSGLFLLLMYFLFETVRPD